MRCALPAASRSRYAELRRAVREIAGGLAELGVDAGDRVGILSATRPEWVLADLGSFRAGAIVVPVYHTNSPEECEHVLGHSEARVVFVEDAAQAAKIARVRDAMPALEHVVVFEGTVEGAITLAELRAAGARTPPRPSSLPPTRPSRRRSSTRRARPARPRAAC